MPLKHAKDVDSLMSCQPSLRSCAGLSLLILAAACSQMATAQPLAATAAATDVIAMAPAPTENRYAAHPDPALTVALSDGTVIALDNPEPRQPLRKAASTEADDLVVRLRNGFAMPANDNIRVQQHMLWLNGKQAYVDRVLERASRFMYLAVAEAERRNLPTELALLPVIESAYDPMATSKSQAAGLWQFIPDTGRLFGLKQNSWYDGRRDPMESTRAAYDYLSQLYATFGNWELVLASYNAGPGTVSRAMKRNAAAGLPTDYWSLKLPAETMGYVPRFLAVVELFRDPASFRVSMPTLPNRPYFRTITAQGPLSLSDVADVTGLAPEMLRVLNPGLRRSAMDPDGPHHVHVPAFLDVARENQIAQMGNGQVRVARSDGGSQPVSVPAAGMTLAVPVAMRQTANAGRHRVQARETWYSIARAYGTRPALLSAANQSSLSTPLEIGRELLIPGGQTTVSTGVAPEVITVATAPNDGRVEIRRRILPGETLESIRRQYQVSLAELRAWNGDLQVLRAGQVLIMRLLPDMLSPRAL